MELSSYEVVALIQALVKNSMADELRGNHQRTRLREYLDELDRLCWAEQAKRTAHIDTMPTGGIGT